MANIGVTACLFNPFNYEFLCDVFSQFLCMIRLLLSGKLSKLRLSFVQCNYVTHRRIIWQSMADFYFLFENAIFGKNTKAIIVHSFVKIWRFGIGNGIEPFCVRMYVYMT